MKKNRILGLFSAALLLLGGACTSDTLDPKNQSSLRPDDEATGGVYLSVDFTMPTGLEGTRSETTETGGSSDGVEIGSAAENYVTSALIVLAAKNEMDYQDEVSGIKQTIGQYGFIVAGEVPSNRIATYASSNPSTLGGKQYRATARLQKENLNTLYNFFNGKDNREVYVFVFSNPTTELLTLFDEAEFGNTSWINAACEVIQTTDATQSKNIGIWGSNSFLMNNVDLATRDLPKNILDWENFTSVDNPFKLSEKNEGESFQTVDNSNSTDTSRGPILVERSVARFDFKDGSPLKDGTAENANRYNVLMNTKENGDADNTKPIVDVQIQKMCLVNMSNKFYYLPRVSPNGLDANSELCGKEKKWFRNTDGTYSGGNYVVGPYADNFKDAPSIKNDFQKYFNFPFFNSSGEFSNEAMENASRWDVVKVSDVLSGTADKYIKPGTQVPTDDSYQGDYHVWRYVTENVIPENINNEVNGITTGIVFKGKLLGSALVDDENATFYEESWDKGYIKNLANCLNGKPFTYNGVTHDLKGSPKEDPILYYIYGHLYMGWRHLRQAAIQAACTVNTAGVVEINISNNLYKAVFGEGGPIPTYMDGEVEKHMVYINPIDGKVYEIKDPLWEAAQKDHESEAWNAYEASANYAWSQWAIGGKEVGDDSTEDKISPALKNMRDAVTGAGIAIFQSSKDADYGEGYYCYYYYWNRHSDNGLNGSRAPMEFDVVRNNVYKLSVDKISRLGHPRIPGNDPNPPTPDTPDESDEIYLRVRIEIVPWVVRLNSIVF